MQVIKKKKLMVLIWSMDIGGIQKRVRDLIIEISSHYPDWEVYLLVRKKNDSPFVEPLVRLPHVYIQYFTASQQKWVFPPSIVWVLWEYIWIRPDVCLTFLPHLVINMMIVRFLVFWHKTKLIYNEGVFMSRYLVLQKEVFLKPILKQAYLQADKIIVPTNACRSDLIKSFFIPREKIVVISNWTLFPSAIPSQIIQYDICFVGRFEKEKGVVMSLEVLSSVLLNFPRLRMVFVGAGSLENTLQDFIASHNLISQWHIQTGGIPWIFQKSKMLILPSLNEGMPNVVLEAAMCQMPAVVNNFPGASEVVIHEETGYIAHNSDEMQQYIELLLKEEALRKKLGRHALINTQKNFSIHRQREFIDAVLQEN